MPAGTARAGSSGRSTCRQHSEYTVGEGATTHQLLALITRPSRVNETLDELIFLARLDKARFGEQFLELGNLELLTARSAHPGKV